MAKNVVMYSRITIVERVTEEAMRKAARMIGGSVEGHAKELCPVDTGLLRNSITFALGGQEPQITEYKSDHDPTGKREEVKGKYEGQAPEDEKGQVSVYVGTNVEYAPYQELGAPNINLNAKPYLRPAMENNQQEIHQIIEKCFNEIK